MHAIVHAADIQDRDGGVLLMATLFGLYPFLLKLYADGGYQGPSFRRALKKVCRVVTSKSSNVPIRPKASWFCRSAGSSSAPSPGSTDAEGSPRIGKTSTARRSHSCASPQSASCCENFVIPLDVSGQTLRYSPRLLRMATYPSTQSSMIASMAGSPLPRWLSPVRDFPSCMASSRVKPSNSLSATVIGRPRIRFHISLNITTRDQSVSSPASETGIDIPWSYTATVSSRRSASYDPVIHHR